MLTLRSLHPEDAKMLFEWRNDPFIIQLGTHQQPVSWEEHVDWILKASINPGTREIYIIEDNKLPIGQVRFDRSTPDQFSCIISVYLLPPHMGKGLGVIAIRKGIEIISGRWRNLMTIQAMVRLENSIGSSAFLKAGFQYFREEKIHRIYNFVTANSIPHNKLTFDSSEVEAVKKVIESGYWANGEEVKNLEKDLALVTGFRYSIAVASGYSALRLSLLAIGVRENDEVIVPAYCCVALPNAILSINAVPIPVDIDADTFVITKEEVAGKLTSLTKAIIAVHTFGYHCDVESIKSLGIPVIEDYAHGFRGRVNQFGETGLAVFSFYATKFIGAGEGGAICTSDPKVCEFLMENRDYTDKAPSRFRQNDKMTNITAGIVRTQLERIEYFLARRLEIAERYFSNLEELEKMGKTFSLPARTNDTWYRFAIREMKDPDGLMMFLGNIGIATARPIENWLQNDTGTFRHAAVRFKDIVSIPVYPALSIEHQDYVIMGIKKFYSNQ